MLIEPKLPSTKVIPNKKAKIVVNNGPKTIKFKYPLM